MKNKKCRCGGGGIDGEKKMCELWKGIFSGRER